MVGVEVCCGDLYCVVVVGFVGDGFDVVVVGIVY